MMEEDVAAAISSLAVTDDRPPPPHFPSSEVNDTMVRRRACMTVARQFCLVKVFM